MVGMGVRHGAAQPLNECRFPCGPSGSPAFRAAQVAFGGLTGGEKERASRSGAVAVTGNRDHASRVAVTAPGFPRAPGIGLELFTADAAGADHGLASVPAVAGVVDQLGRLLDDRHLLDPAARPGGVVVVGVADAGDVEVSGGGGVISAGFLRPGLPPGVAGPLPRICGCQPPPGMAARGTAGRDERQGHARDHGNRNHDGYDDLDQARPVHDVGPLSRIWRVVAGPGGSAVGGAAGWAGSRISS
jgi:hypothetical protein